MMILASILVFIAVFYGAAVKRYSSNYIPKRKNEADIPDIWSRYITRLDMDMLLRPLEFNGFTVPQNYLTDMTTTYWFIRWFIPRYSKANVACVIHDYHYTHAGINSRAAADEVFRIHLIMSGMSPHRARLYWCGVRVGGFRGWNNYRKQKTNHDAMDYSPDILEAFKRTLARTDNKRLEVAWHQ